MTKRELEEDGQGRRNGGSRKKKERTGPGRRIHVEGRAGDFEVSVVCKAVGADGPELWELEVRAEDFVDI